METFGQLVEVANQLSWPGAVAVSFCAMAMAAVIISFVKSVWG